LLQAGTLFNRPQWTKDGKTILSFVEKHAFLSHYHVFASYMDNVLLPNGKLNPTETFFRGTDLGGSLINDGQITVALAGQEILSLLDAYTVISDETLFTKAKELLAPLRAQTNTLGLWDSHQLGYYGGLTFPGKTIAQPGKPVLNKKTKQGGLQLLMFEAFQEAETLSGGEFSSMVAALQQVALKKAFYAAGHGYLDQESADWKPLVVQSGENAAETEDWVTSEAMDIALQALQTGPVSTLDNVGPPSIFPAFEG
jgi:hypothetical protein